MKFKTNSDQETRNLAKKLVRNFLELEKSRENALVISLEGELGSGKTTFAQGLAQELGISDWIKSPTFILMREHVIQGQSSNFKTQNRKTKIKADSLSRLYHIDCYRLDSPKALTEIGLEEILKNPQNIVLIEWGNKIKELLPKDMVRISFRHLRENKREIALN